MPQRIIGAWWIAAGLVGVAAVGLWALCGRDPRTAMRNGPRWKRALLAAGLSVLAALGWSARVGQAREPAAVAGDAGAARDSGQAVMALLKMQAKLAELQKLTAPRDVHGPAITAAADEIDSLAAVLRKHSNVAKLTPQGQAEGARLLALADKRVAAARALVPIGTSDLVRAPQWKVVVDAWRHAGPLAKTGKSTTAKRKEADEKFKAAAVAIAALSRAGLLSAAETGLLTIDAARLGAEIYRNPPTDSMVTCYEMAFMPPARASLARLQQQATFLKKIAAARTLAPVVLDKVLGAIERDLAILADPKQTELLDDDRKPTADALRKEMLPLVAQIKRRVLSERLGRTTGWAKLEAALAFGKALGDRSTTAQRKEFDGKVAVATAALAALGRTLAITEGESMLIKGELERVRRAVYRRPPTDARVTCYAMAFTAPARRSFMRLRARVAILKRLSESGRLNPAVLAKVLPTVRADVRTLSEDKELARLGQGRTEAEALRKQVEPILAAIEKQLASEGGK